jgi:class 3 adenylate cyclase
VSVLFLDVVGSTTLAQRLDPEEIHDLVDGLLRRCTGVVAQHGGSRAAVRR